MRPNLLVVCEESLAGRVAMVVESDLTVANEDVVTRVQIGFDPKWLEVGPNVLLNVHAGQNVTCTMTKEYSMRQLPTRLRIVLLCGVEDVHMGK